MSAEQTNQVTEADVRSVAEKLGQLGMSMSEGEQVVLSRLIVQAEKSSISEGEVQGYFTLIETPNFFQMGDGSVRPAGSTLPAVQTGLLLPAVQIGAGGAVTTNLGGTTVGH